MRCIFVLDIFNGEVVHAVRGDRHRYKPIQVYSKLVSTSDPLAILKQIQPQEIYIADLNRLMGSGDNLAIIEKISSLRMTMVDIGVKKINDLSLLPKKTIPVLGTETASWNLIKDAAMQYKIIVSIDIKTGKVISEDPELAAQSPLTALKKLNLLPLRSVILLKLDRVGTSAGLDLEFLKNAIAVSKHPLILGGGVRNMTDVKTLRELGFEGVLVATAVHNRKIVLSALSESALIDQTLKALKRYIFF